MTSGTTEYTPDQVLEMCWQYMSKASKTFVSENEKINKRLAKSGITPAEFVMFSMRREQIELLAAEVSVNL